MTTRRMLRWNQRAQRYERLGPRWLEFVTARRTAYPITESSHPIRYGLDSSHPTDRYRFPIMIPESARDLIGAYQARRFADAVENHAKGLLLREHLVQRNRDDFVRVGNERSRTNELNYRLKVTIRTLLEDLGLKKGAVDVGDPNSED